MQFKVLGSLTSTLSLSPGTEHDAVLKFWIIVCIISLFMIVTESETRWKCHAGLSLTSLCPKSHHDNLTFFQFYWALWVFILCVLEYVWSVLTAGPGVMVNEGLLRSRGPGFKSHSFIISSFYICLCPFQVRVIINVRCRIVKKSEWYSGKTQYS